MRKVSDMNLRDRSRPYCFLNEAEIVLEHELATTPEDREGDYSVGCRAAPDGRGGRSSCISSSQMKARDIRELGPVWLGGGAQRDLLTRPFAKAAWQAHTNPIKRPAATIPTHNRIETKPETFAFMGKRAPSSQFVTSR